MKAFVFKSISPNYFYTYYTVFLIFINRKDRANARPLIKIYDLLFFDKFIIVSVCVIFYCDYIHSFY